ncbi:MAG: amino acid permease [Gemmatimonadota bacterium]|nr:MAG: amino acid permease [Gemmatimonadota bacterium]
MAGNSVGLTTAVPNAGSGHGFGTAPVFLASISTILGAILFLRFGYAVGHTGLLGALLIVLLGHLVTIPTALAISEIATNRRVEGGGEYFIISRSFGTTIGGAIGISLYLSQAISVAFYMIALAEAFRPLAPLLESVLPGAFDPRFISLPATGVLAVLMLRRGANIGVKALWVVVAILALSLLLFGLGGTPEGVALGEPGLLDTVADSDPFILVFAIVFPAFTGMTAGVGLSGDLANPSRSIPLGVLGATLTGMVVYVLVSLKFASSAPPELLAGEQFVMARIAVWGPIIPIGLACATLSSAIGSILVAPRTLQALAADGITPIKRVNALLAKGVGNENEPRAATVLTVFIALAMVAAGNVDIVARIISMFFMVTYGALCTISFLEHFAARPSYRPSFRSKWFLSLLGSLMCLFMMFQMDPVFALLALIVMVGIYRGLRRIHGEDDLAAIFQGVMTQVSRRFQIKLQSSTVRQRSDAWRPSVIMVNGRTFERTAPLQFLSWLCHRYGVGTYIHYIKGHLKPDTFRESRQVQARLVKVVQQRKGAIYVDTMISPSMRSALGQSLQLPGVSGTENNCILSEFTIEDPTQIHAEIQEACDLASAARVSSLVLRHSDRSFGQRATIHVWLTWHDYKNANLMILLSYILLGHPDWRKSEIRIFAAFPAADVGQQRTQLHEMITSGRLPVSKQNVRVIATDETSNFAQLVESRSSEADLVVLGFTDARLREKGFDLLLRHPSLGDVLFVSAQERVVIE